MSNSSALRCTLCPMLEPAPKRFSVAGKRCVDWRTSGSAVGSGTSTSTARTCLTGKPGRAVTSWSTSTRISCRKIRNRRQLRVYALHPHHLLSERRRSYFVHAFQFFGGSTYVFVVRERATLECVAPPPQIVFHYFRTLPFPVL